MKQRRIPTKQELIQLQKLYRTDRRIGEALGNVSEQLVAYWRRKKGIGKTFFPKYSQQEIKDLWERLGDDENAGQELGITKQAFYRWRKKYKLFDRPAILRLEQLELKFFDEQRLNRTGDRVLPAQTHLQKIISYHTGNEFVPVGQGVTTPHDLSVSFDEYGITVISANQFPGATAQKPHRVRFSSFEDLFEAGYFRPGLIVVSNRIEAAAMAVTGSYVRLCEVSSELKSLGNRELTIDVLPTLRVSIPSALPGGYSMFELACRVKSSIASFDDHGFVIELHGSGVERISVENRIPLAIYTTLITRRHVLFEPDQTLLNMRQAFDQSDNPIPFSDKKASFLDDVVVTLAKSKPRLYDLRKGDYLVDLNTLDTKSLRRIIVGPYTGGTLENIKQVAQALHSREIKKGVEIFVLPSNRHVFAEALKRRYIHTIVNAGGMVGNFNCSPRFETLNNDEFELTTEVSSKEGSVILCSLAVISQALRSGRIPKRIVEVN